MSVLSLQTARLMPATMLVTLLPPKASAPAAGPVATRDVRPGSWPSLARRARGGLHRSTSSLARWRSRERARVPRVLWPTAGW